MIKNLKYLVFAILMFMINISFIKANEIYSIDVDVNLDENGNGFITEKWDVNATSGTEIYKPIGDLGNSQITDFKVFLETGEQYNLVSSWNVNSSLNSKAYKNGINKTSDGLELCWGISSYGKHTYTLTYNVSNMIYNVEDAQILYWKFINDSMNAAPQNFTVKISGPTYYEQTLDVWGYGYTDGYAYVKDGSIYMSNNEKRGFKSDEYVVVLVKYPSNTFITDNKTDKFNTFDEVFELAKDGSFPQGLNNFSNKVSKVKNIFSGIVVAFTAIINVIIVFVIIAFSGKITTSKSTTYIKRSIDNNNLNNYRDIPCEKNIFKAFFLAEVYKLNRKKEDLLGAVLLKWLKEDKVSVIKQQKKKMFGKKQITAIDLTKYTPSDNDCENELYNMMNTASKDGILEENELKQWCSKNYSKFFKWFDKVIEQTRDEYINAGLITVTETGSLFKHKTYTLDNYVLHEEATKLAGLKKYLKEFSRINEKQPIEVKLWEEYLIYAQIFGIAKEVANQFKKLYPELIEQANYGFGYANIIWIDTITSRGINSATSARSAAQSYSSGGGGSFGGGHGGGFR